MFSPIDILVHWTFGTTVSSQWLHVVEKGRALPETYLLSMGQFLCVVMTMIDSKQTYKTDLQQFTCTFVSWQKEPWIYYTPLFIAKL